MPFSLVIKLVTALTSILKVKSYLGVDGENFIIATKEDDVNVNINIGTSLQSAYINGYDFLASDEVEDPLLYSKQRPILLLGNLRHIRQIPKFTILDFSWNKFL